MSSWTPGVWGTNLRILVSSVSEHPTIHLHASSNNFFGFFLRSDTEAGRESVQQCLTWLAEHAAGFLKVQLIKVSYDQSLWLFARIVFALGAASMSVPSAFEGYLDAGRLCLFVTSLVAVFCNIAAGGSWSSWTNSDK